MLVTVDLKERNKRKKIINEIICHNEKVANDRKPYKASDWCRSMAKAAVRATDSKGNFRLGSTFINELRNKQGTPKVPEHAKQELKDKGYRV